MMMMMSSKGLDLHLKSGKATAMVTTIRVVSVSPKGRDHQPRSSKGTAKSTMAKRMLKKRPKARDLPSKVGKGATVNTMIDPRPTRAETLPPARRPSIPSDSMLWSSRVDAHLPPVPVCYLNMYVPMSYLT